MSNGNTNYYDKEVWSNIPIDYDEAMSTGEAHARGLQIIGLDDYLRSKAKNPKVQKFSIVMQGQLYFFPVDPKYTDSKKWDPNAPGYTLTRNLNQLVTYDAYHLAEAFLTQPLLMVAGSQAGSRWMSENLIERAASNDKQLEIIEGGNHMSFYDLPNYVDQAVSKLTPFFQRTL